VDLFARRDALTPDCQSSSHTNSMPDQKLWIDGRGGRCGCKNLRKILAMSLRSTKPITWERSRLILGETWIINRELVKQRALCFFRFGPNIEIFPVLGYN